MSKYDVMTEIELLEKVRRNGFAIKLITAPSEAVCMAAVGQVGNAIKHIKTPSRAVMLAAVRQNGHAIQFIKNLSETVRITAVQQNRHAIQHIRNPSEAVQLAAVSQDGRMIKHINTPSEAVCMAAVNQMGEAIINIRNPSKEVQIAAIKKNYKAISYINQARLYQEPLCSEVIATQLVYHPFSAYVMKNKTILDRAPEILEAHCPGLGDVYTIGLSMAMTGEDLSRTMAEWIESHADTAVAIGAEMSP